jgi:hypothetical protein
MGGVWTVVTARSPEEIVQKYPAVKIIDTRPGWMTDEIYERSESFDIDDEPRGWLAKLRQE